MGKKGLAALLCVFLFLLAFTRIETEIFVSSAAHLKADLFMVALIFMHNSLAATAVAVGMLFLACLIDVLPERFKRCESPVLKHPRFFSAVFAALLVSRSLFRFNELNALNVFLLLVSLPVTAIEVCGLHLAALFGPRRRVSAPNMAKVYATFFVGAAVETCIIYLCSLLFPS